MHKIANLAILFVLVLLTAAGMVHARSKTDVILLENGDNITGEIKELYRGRLKISTSSMSTVYIEWLDIVTLESQYYFEMEDQEGYKYYGTPELTEEGVFRVTRADAVVSLEKLQVIRITPIEESFWSRINGSVSLGFSYTKGSQIGRTDFAFDVRYRVEKNFVQLRGSSSVTTENNAESVTRSDASLTYQHLFARRVFTDANGSTFRNDEQGIALRLTLGAGLGANVVQTNSSVLLTTLGLSINREWPTNVQSLPTNNLEGVITAGYNVYIYNTPKTDLSTSVGVFPRLPDFDRLRVDVEASWTQEIISDFTVVLTFWDNYNSEPPSETDAKNDWGITTSIGYKF
jgi:putative salt-induced outer membrane protein YdiY